MSEARINTLLQRMRQGDRAALCELLELTYEQLHRVAAVARAPEKDPRARRTTSLLNAFVCQKLLPNAPDSLESEAHFYNWSGLMMRRLLIDDARKRARDPLAAGTSAEGWPAGPGDDSAFDLQLDDVLQRLEAVSPRPAAVFSFRWFGQRSVVQTSAVLGIAERTVVDDYRYARAWLRRELASGDASHW